MKAFVRIFAVLLALVMMPGPGWAASSSNINKPATPKDVPAPQFAKVIDDLPLMPGLKVQEDKDVLFIVGPKRIAQTTATGMVDVDDVYTYYEKSLPQLGWRKLSARLYERGSERLRLNVSGANAQGLTIVRFAVEPVTVKGR